MSIEYQIPLILSSSINAGATNKSTSVSNAGSRFQVNLEQALNIPYEAKNVSIELTQANIWWTFKNILEGVNDHFYLKWGALDETLIIPSGLYDTSSLQSAINREATKSGFPDSIVVLIPDSSTSRVVLQLPLVGTQVSFVQNDTMRDILGADPILYPTLATTAIYKELLPKIATFNTISYLLAQSDLVSTGLSVNGKFAQTISNIPITVKPGSLINFTPFVPIRLYAQELAGSQRRHINVWLTNQDGEPVNTSDEDYSLHLVIRYSL
jgi:hypothetical protein